MLNGLCSVVRVCVMSLAKALSIQPRRRRPGMTEKKVDWDVNYHYKQTGCKVN